MRRMKISAQLLSLSLFIFLLSCEPLVNIFSNNEPALTYQARNVQSVPPKTKIKVITWNIRFGAARISWFGDECGHRVILKKSEVIDNLSNLAKLIKELDPDLLLLQEVDVESKRTAYIDQMQWLLDHTDFNYGVYASMWESQVILADGLGRINTGNAILSKWELKNAERLQLALRGDQDKLTKYFYLRRNVLKAEVNMPGTAGFFAVCVHAAAFATDDTKLKHIQGFKDILDAIIGDGGSFVAGGDLNSLPPAADSTDYCEEDKCFGDSFHGAGDKPLHREGSYFTPEADWLSLLYDENTGYYPAISLSDYLKNEALHFTHSSAKNPEMDRKLDYLWTNTGWIPGSGKTHQEAKSLSDHLPVSAGWEVP